MSNFKKEILLETVNLCRFFEETGERVDVLNNVDFKIYSGEMVALTGVSGAGKSTFLNIIGALDKPSSGEVFFKGKDLNKFSSSDINLYRQKHVGFIFQFHHLLPEFSALENLLVPAKIKGTDPAEALDFAEELLTLTGLQSRKMHLPRELSGGERQRVAVARALMNQPDIVLADEPSGNLDSKNSEKLHQLFCDLNEKYGQAFLIVTHDKELSGMTSRQVEMRDGIIVGGSF
jgi:lipoprotein-releasing system ATP-binding protein